LASKFKGIAGIVAVILKIEANLKIAGVPVKCIPNLPYKIPFQVSQTSFY